MSPVSRRALLPALLMAFGGYCTVYALDQWPPQRVAVRSIVNIGYHHARQVLEIEFHTGSLYRYRYASAQIHSALIAAESNETYFSRAICNHYP